MKDLPLGAQDSSAVAYAIRRNRGALTMLPQTVNSTETVANMRDHINDVASATNAILDRWQPRCKRLDVCCH